MIADRENPEAPSRNFKNSNGFPLFSKTTGGAMVKKIRVEAGQEVMKTLADEFARQGIRSGAIVSVVGAVDGCCISNMPASDAHHDILTEYEEPFEVSGVGEVRDGKPHIHCVLGREGDQALSGHLHWAHVRTWFVTAYVLAMD